MTAAAASPTMPPLHSLALPLLAPLPAACIETHLLPNEDHCALQAGDEHCAELHPDGSRPYCMRGYCEAEGAADPRPLDGCVAERPAEDACYSPCGHGSSLLEDASCLAPATTTTDPEPSTTDPGPQPVCGDAVLDADETCDDGELNGAAGHCGLDCQGPTPYCGDGRLHSTETCDDGNAIEGDGCNPDCHPSGSVVWERELNFTGFIRGVDVAPDDVVYLAGAITSPPARSWAARLDHRDSTIDWAHTTETPDGVAQGDAFFATQALDEGLIVFAGRSAKQAYSVLLDENGELVEEGVDPSATYLREIVEVDGGYLGKRGDDATRYNYALSPQWTTTVGSGLAYRPGDAFALAALADGASFRRFTLDGLAFEPVVFWVPMSFLAQTELVAWTLDGDVVVAGQVSTEFARDALVIKSSLGGTARWIYGFADLQDQLRHADCLTVDANDAVIVGGYSTFLEADHPFLMKLSVDGEVLWRRDLEFRTITGRIQGCTTNAANEIIAVGEADGRMWLAKVTP